MHGALICNSLSILMTLRASCHCNHEALTHTLCCAPLATLRWKQHSFAQINLGPKDCRTSVWGGVLWGCGQKLIVMDYVLEKNGNH